MMKTASKKPKSEIQRISFRLFPLLLGPAFFCFTLISPAPFIGMSDAAWLAAGLAALMATWWVSEAVPIPVTALLPVVLAPLIGLSTLKQTTASYAHPLIFLFLGGFILSLAMERWQLHKRIALLTMLAVGDRPERQLAGLMGITAFLSMWMSNTATAVMMLPIALSIIHMNDCLKEDLGFSKALLLGLAYSASIGGVATLIGTPPNALMAAYLSDNYAIDIGFAQWMCMALPLSLLLLFCCWCFLSHYFKLTGVQGGSHSSKTVLKQRLKELGPLQNAELAVAAVFITTALAWIMRPLLSQWTGLALSDPGIAMTAAVILFLIPVRFKSLTMVMDWQTAKKVPWEVLILFGGGLSLAAQIKHSGLADFIAQSLVSAQDFPLWALILLVTSAIVFLTEITSNTATAAGFLPLLGPVAMSMTGSPLLLVMACSLAASCAFMMPVATPPNSIVFASGQVKVMDMAKAGLYMNFIAIAFITSLLLLLNSWFLDTIHTF